METKQEALCEKLAKKIRKEKPYDFSEKVKESLETAAEALSEENFRDPDKVAATKKAINEDIELLERRQKLFKLADQSEYGWRTVEEYEEDNYAKDSDDEKRIAIAEYSAEKKQKRAAAKMVSSNKEFSSP